MKQFFIKTLYFILPLLFVAIIMEYLLRNIPNDYSNKKDYLNEHAGDIETLILGSSNALFGINPDYFSTKTFNASYVSQTLDIDFEILKKYQDKYDNVKVIVLPISYFSFWSILSEGEDAWRMKNYVIYCGINPTISLTNYSEILSNNLKVNIKRLWKYYIENESNIYCTKLGWGTAYNSKEAQDLYETAKTAALRHTITNDINASKQLKIYNKNISTLDSIMYFCNTHKIKLLLLTTPTYVTYREKLNEKQLSMMYRTINEFVASHEDCYFFDFFENTDFMAKDFYDADHLDEIGAEKLSKKLSYYIDSLKLLK